jgi:D-glycero-D-manno-heptose 1,7-bisphosphate phosphatase
VIYKIAFLDRDGTINVEKDYLYKIEDFEFLPGVIEGLKILQEHGYLLVIATNQSGIARGFYTVDDMKKLHTWMLNELKKFGIEISGIYFCPHLPDAPIAKYRINCNCRKPKTGMFKKAICDLSKKYQLDLKNSVAIGDKMRDLTIANEIGARAILIGDECMDPNVIVTKNFFQAVEILTTLQ